MIVFETPWLFFGKFNGLCLGPLVFVKDITDDKVIRHEATHSQQWRDYYYVGFVIIYLYQVLRYGYKAAPFEVAARSAE